MAVTLELSPAVVAPGGTCNYVAKGCPARATYTVAFRGSQVGAGTVGSTGIVSRSFVVPAGTPVGQHPVTFTVQTASPVTATLSVGANNATLSFSPSSAAAGATVKMIGNGFVGFRPAQFIWGNNPPIILGVIPGGQWSMDLKIANDAVPGPVLVTVTQVPYGHDRTGSNTFTVLASAANGIVVGTAVPSASMPNKPFPAIVTVKNAGQGNGELRARLFIDNSLVATSPPVVVFRGEEQNFNFTGIESDVSIDITFKVDTLIGTAWTETDSEGPLHVTIDPDVGTIVLELDKPVGAKQGDTVTLSGAVRVNGAKPNLSGYRVNLKVASGLGFNNVLFTAFLQNIHFAPNGDFSVDWFIPPDTFDGSIDAELQLFLDTMPGENPKGEKRVQFTIADAGGGGGGDDRVAITIANIQGNFNKTVCTISGSVEEGSDVGDYRLHVKVWNNDLAPIQIHDSYVTPDEFSKWYASFTPKLTQIFTHDVPARVDVFADPIPYQGFSIGEAHTDFVIRGTPIDVKFGDVGFDPPKVPGHIGDQTTLNVEYGAFLEDGIAAHAYIQVEQYNSETEEYELIEDSVYISPDKVDGGLSFNKNYEMTFSLTEEMTEGQTIKFRVSSGSYDKDTDQLISIDDVKVIKLQIGNVTFGQWIGEHWVPIALVGGLAGAGAVGYKVLGGKTGIQRLVELKLLKDLAAP